jgi:hypothetical protein
MKTRKTDQGMDFGLRIEDSGLRIIEDQGLGIRD